MVIAGDLESDLICFMRRHFGAPAAKKHSVSLVCSMARLGLLFEAMNHTLVMMDRKRVGRAASPTASRSRPTENGGPRGYDARKKIMGRKRHALVDTDGREPELFAHPASV